MKTSPQDPYRKARNAALSILARRRHSKAEVRRKLSARGFDTAVIERVIAACERLDYVDDEEAASFFVEELVRKQVGVRRIQEEMKSRGFDPDLIQSTIDGHDLHEREAEIAERAMEKKRAALNREQDPRKRREKLIRFLRSRGFRLSTISALSRRFEPEDDL